MSPCRVSPGGGRHTGTAPGLSGGAGTLPVFGSKRQKADAHVTGSGAWVSLAAGGKARIVGVPNSRGRVAHVAPQAFHDGAWHWAETTVDAAFGEHPRIAARRLGLNRRPDVT